MSHTRLLRQRPLVLDGGMGTQLQKAGLRPGELPEKWNLTHREELLRIHRAYLEAGADVIYANTFGANRLHYGEETEAVVTAGVALAREAVAQHGNGLVALDIGPTGKLLAPLGDLDFEEAVAIFAQVVEAGTKAGADLAVIETMNDLYEVKAALLAVKEHSTLPVIVTGVFGEDGKMMTGADPETLVALAESMGAWGVGMNCSLGPKEMLPLLRRMLACASVPVLAKPNAGLPTEVKGETVYNVSAAEFAEDAAEMLRMGASGVGGCCGTTPEYIARLRPLAEAFPPPCIRDRGRTTVSSYTHTVTFGDAPLLIGERINPTGKKRLKAALAEGDMNYILGEAVNQAERGVHILDVNVGLPEINEAAMLTRAVTEIQAVTDLPLQIDTADPVAMERALRRYNGKALVNSVNGKQEVMDAVFPLVRKYGGTVIALTLDENGIPATAQGRVAIARRIVDEAAKYGIGPKDLVFDTLAMAVSADKAAPGVALEALQCIRYDMGIHTSLGVSNISFGLPCRDAVNGTFFAMALERGLSAAIMNPYSRAMTDAYRAFCALRGYDDRCLQYIDYASRLQATEAAAPTATAAAPTLQYAIQKGLKSEAERAAQNLLQHTAPPEIINQEIVPALNAVGVGFEEKRLFLPQLLMSAEAASAAFEVLKRALGEGGTRKRLRVVLATVKGDIHDIGKNIVKTMLENYGFAVVDLGKDVPPEKVVEAVKASGAAVAGLSALMTTTVPAMKDTIDLLQRECPTCRTLVGGAVLNEEYAAMIHATRYAKDAMESVRYCEEVEQELYE